MAAPSAVGTRLIALSLRIPGLGAEPDEVEKGAPRDQPAISCEWCGLLTAPGPLCEVCGSPLPSGSVKEIILEDADLTAEETFAAGLGAPGATGPGADASWPPEPSRVPMRQATEESSVPSDAPGRSGSSFMAMSEELTSLASPERDAPQAEPEAMPEVEPIPSFDHGPSAPAPEAGPPGSPLSAAGVRACSRCGQPSEHQLCDACREAFRQLQELSLGLGEEDG
jgi:hypothetical protein